MGKYIFRRLLLFIPTFLGASVLIFLILRVVPGDVALVVVGGTEEGAIVDQREYQRVREMLGLNERLPVQYLKWLKGVVTFEPGESVTLSRGVKVLQLVRERLPVTLQLGVYTLAITFAFAIPVGVFAAIYRDSWFDYVFRSVAIIGLAMPNFFVATMIILFLVLQFQWSPPIFYKQLWDQPGSHLSQMIWPALILSWGSSSILVRITRSSMLEVLRQDYIRTAEAKGLPNRIVLWRHALRNAMLPVMTIMGLQLAGVLNGSVIMETIFGLPGMGKLVLDSINIRDFAVTQFTVMLFVVVALVINLGVDLTYGMLDPRIRYD
ncbi:MAG: ABC transporter permease [Chloroflexi bacterium]|nr:ABC transporter permease [Chloroflexota bacterium]